MNLCTLSGLAEFKGVLFPISGQNLVPKQALQNQTKTVLGTLYVEAGIVGQSFSGGPRNPKASGLLVGAKWSSTESTDASSRDWSLRSEYGRYALSVVADCAAVLFLLSGYGWAIDLRKSTAFC